MKLRNGWYWPDEDEYMWREMKNGGYQTDHLDAALAFVTDWSCAIDGGAHVGVWTKTLAARFKHVISVEPATDTHECLIQNVRAMRVDNADVVHAALGRVAGFVSLGLDAKQSARGNTGARYISGFDYRHDISLETIDSWNVQSLGFLKLDIEGSEPDAIKGAAQTVSRCKPVVLFEDKGFCTRYGHAKDASQTLLASLGYQHKARIGHDEIWAART